MAGEREVTFNDWGGNMVMWRERKGSTRVVGDEACSCDLQILSRYSTLRTTMLISPNNIY